MKFNPPDIWINTKKSSTGFTFKDILYYIDDEFGTMMVSTFSPSDWDTLPMLNKVVFIKTNVRKLYWDEFKEELSNQNFLDYYDLLIDEMMKSWLSRDEYAEWRDCQ